MQKTVDNWEEFRQAWDGVQNFMMAGECVPFDFEVPPIAQVVDEVRRDEETSIGSGAKGRSLLSDDIALGFRQLPLMFAMQATFTLAHYHLSRFDKPGSFLHGFRERVLVPWQEALTAAGFTFERCYPIIFISGAGCATNYHMDFSHVVAWQVHGTKNFCGLKDPDRWAPQPVRLGYQAGKLEKPLEITDEDALCYTMRPGDMLWNCMLTPHWVEASGEVAMSINLSHGGLRLNGRLAPHEQQLEEYRAAHPDVAPAKVTGVY